MLTFLGILGAIVLGAVVVVLICVLFGGLGLMVGLFGWLIEAGATILGCLLIFWCVAKIIMERKK